jgi:hypothetical protein
MTVGVRLVGRADERLLCAVSGSSAGGGARHTVVPDYEGWLSAIRENAVSLRSQIVIATPPFLWPSPTYL